MTTRFTYDDQVRISANAPAELHPGELAWIVAVYQAGEGPTYRTFGVGPVYTVEFEGGTAIDVEEDFLELVKR